MAAVDERQQKVVWGVIASLEQCASMGRQKNNTEDDLEDEEREVRLRRRRGT